jgi:hypothetical protein
LFEEEDAMPRKKRDKTLTPDMIWKKIVKSEKRYKKFNFLERYAVFMGKRRRYRYGERRLGRMTLGQAIFELERLGMRPDFIWQMRQLNQHRIRMAHEFLADHFHFVSLDRRFARLSWRPLRDALFRVEESIHVFDHLNQNKMLYQRQRIAY